MNLIKIKEEIIGYYRAREFNFKIYIVVVLNQNIFGFIIKMVL